MVMNFLSTIDKLTNNPLARGVEFFWNKYKKKKITMLREVILSEIRQGDFSNVDSDDLVGISYRLQKDAMEGIAKNNLRLLCAMIAGLHNNNKLTAQNFLKFAQILEGLTEEEIKVIAYDLWPILNPQPKHSDETSGVVKNGVTEIYECENHKLWREDRENFIKQLKIPADINTIRYALLRTGLYFIKVHTSTTVKIYDDGSGNNAESHTGVEFKQSSLMEELIPYIKNVILWLD